MTNEPKRSPRALAKPATVHIRDVGTKVGALAKDSQSSTFTG